MKEKYEAPVIEIAVIDEVDIIFASGGTCECNQSPAECP